MIDIREYSLPEYQAYLVENRHHRDLRGTTSHHTWSPTVAQDRGLPTVQAVQRAQVAAGRANRIMANAYTTRMRTVCNGRHLWDGNYAHAYVSIPWSRCSSRLREWCHGDRMAPNQYSFGCETIGNGDVENPENWIAMQTTLDVLAMVHRIWQLPVECCQFFHREGADKSCPGNNVSLAWVHDQLRLRGVGSMKVKVVLLPGNTVVPCDARVEGGGTRADLRPLVEALDYEVIWHPEQGPPPKAYLRRKPKEE